jgi:SAM-dependent methyltransferase
MVDIAFAIFVVHEVPDPQRLFREIAAILKPGGRFFYSEPIIVVPGRQWRANLAVAESARFHVIERRWYFLNRAALLEKVCDELGSFCPGSRGYNPGLFPTMFLLIPWCTLVTWYVVASNILNIYGLGSFDSPVCGDMWHRLLDDARTDDAHDNRMNISPPGSQTPLIRGPVLLVTRADAGIAILAHRSRHDRHPEDRLHPGRRSQRTGRQRSHAQEHAQLPPPGQRPVQRNGLDYIPALLGPLRGRQANDDVHPPSGTPRYVPTPCTLQSHCGDEDPLDIFPRKREVPALHSQQPT